MRSLIRLASAAMLLAGPALAQPCKPQKAETDVAGVRVADETSARRVLGDPKRRFTRQDKDAQGVDEDFAYVRVVSADGRQEARFYSHYGDIAGSYNEIEVLPAGRASAADPNAIRLPLPHLATERGVRLGMGRDELLRLLGSCHSTQSLPGGATRIAYTIDDASHALLKRTHMPSYFARYDFKDGKLARFRIGLDYP